MIPGLLYFSPWLWDKIWEQPRYEARSSWDLIPRYSENMPDTLTTNLLGRLAEDSLHGHSVWSPFCSGKVPYTAKHMKMCKQIIIVWLYSTWLYYRPTKTGSSPSKQQTKDATTHDQSRGLETAEPTTSSEVRADRSGIYIHGSAQVMGDHEQVPHKWVK